MHIHTCYVWDPTTQATVVCNFERDSEPVATTLAESMSGMMKCPLETYKTHHHWEASEGLQSRLLKNCSYNRDEASWWGSAIGPTLSISLSWFCLYVAFSAFSFSWTSEQVRLICILFGPVSSHFSPSKRLIHCVSFSLRTCNYTNCMLKLLHCFHDWSNVTVKWVVGHNEVSIYKNNTACFM